MARRPNYGFEKRQKELDKQKKKEAKAEKREQRKLEAAADADLEPGGLGNSDPNAPQEDLPPVIVE